MTNLRESLAQLLHKAGLTATFLTWTGLGAALLSGFYILYGQFFWAGALLLLAGGIDLMDGAVARLSGQANPAGGMLDSSLDRYGDGAVLGALTITCAATGRTLYAFLALSALLGSFEISYVRARAECEIEDCRVGFWERGERIICICAGLILNNIALSLWLLGIGTHATAMYRLYHASRRVSGLAGLPAWNGWGEALFHAGGRQKPLYLVKAALVLGALLFWRLPF